MKNKNKIREASYEYDDEIEDGNSRWQDGRRGPSVFWQIFRFQKTHIVKIFSSCMIQE